MGSFSLEIADDILDEARIPPEERDSVFRPFRRAAAVGRSVPGAGLGLSIAKLLVEMQGGRIDFESAPGRTTRFWVDLPLAA